MDGPSGRVDQVHNPVVEPVLEELQERLEATEVVVCQGTSRHVPLSTSSASVEDQRCVDVPSVVGVGESLRLGPSLSIVLPGSRCVGPLPPGLSGETVDPVKRVQEDPRYPPGLRSSPLPTGLPRPGREWTSLPRVLPVVAVQVAYQGPALLLLVRFPEEGLLPPQVDAPDPALGPYFNSRVVGPGSRRSRVGLPGGTPSFIGDSGDGRSRAGRVVQEPVCEQEVGPGLQGLPVPLERDRLPLESVEAELPTDVLHPPQSHPVLRVSTVLPCRRRSVPDEGVE